MKMENLEDRSKILTWLVEAKTQEEIKKEIKKEEYDSSTIIIKEELDIKTEEEFTNDAFFNSDNVLFNSENSNKASGNSFTDSSEFKAHLKEYTGEKQLSSTEHFGTNGCKRELPQTDKSDYAGKICGKSFNVNSLTCTICDESFNLQSDLDYHKLIHEVPTIHHCKTCNKTFQSKTTLCRHKRIHTIEKCGPPKYSCEICGKAYRQESALNLHKEVYSCKKKKSVTPCPICNKKVTKDYLNHHIRIHTGEKNYVCPICGKLFMTKGYLTLHEKSHSTERNCECKICGKFFPERTFKRHAIIHTKKNDFTCEICGKAIKGKTNAYSHKLRHMEDKQHKCLICGKSFYQKTVLESHLTSHTGEKKFNCTICDKTFTQRTTLRNHMKGHKRK